MNSVKAVYVIETYSTRIEMNIDVTPQVGIDAQGTYKRVSQAGCAQALAILLDGIEASLDDLKEAIEQDINGNTDNPTSEDSED